MRYSDLKNLKTFCESLDSSPDWREVVENLESDDFEVDNVRFIADDVIADVLADELGNDEYMLGCFNASFLSEVTEIDSDVFEAMRKAEAYEAIGKLVISLGKLPELAELYARYDGYGHHFNSWDGNEEEVTINGRLFHVFDNH